MPGSWWTRPTRLTQYPGFPVILSLHLGPVFAVILCDPHVAVVRAYPEQPWTSGDSSIVVIVQYWMFPSPPFPVVSFSGSLVVRSGLMSFQFSPAERGFHEDIARVHK